MSFFINTSLLSVIAREGEESTGPFRSGESATSFLDLLRSYGGDGSQGFPLDGWGGVLRGGFRIDGRIAEGEKERVVEGDGRNVAGDENNKTENKEKKEGGPLSHIRLPGLRSSTGAQSLLHREGCSDEASNAAGNHGWLREVDVILRKKGFNAGARKEISEFLRREGWSGLGEKGKVEGFVETIISTLTRKTGEAAPAEWIGDLSLPETGPGLETEKESAPAADSGEGESRVGNGEKEGGRNIKVVLPEGMGKPTILLEETEIASPLGIKVDSLPSREEVSGKFFSEVNGFVRELKEEVESRVVFEDALPRETTRSCEEQVADGLLPSREGNERSAEALTKNLFTYIN